MQDNERGLTAEEVECSRCEHGENKLCEYKRKSFIRCYLGNLNDPIIKVLLVAFFINILFMFPDVNWFECGGILLSVIIATLVSTFSEYSSENTFEKLRAENQNCTVVVKRDGDVCEIKSEELVVGDLCVVTSGQGIMADCILVRGELFVDESALSGESAEVKKVSGDSLLKGSLALSGECLAKVEKVGEKTYYGKIAKELSQDPRPSPLKIRLTSLAKTISKLGYVAALMIALAYLFNTFVIDAGFDWHKTASMLENTKFLFSKLLNALTLAVSIVVVAVPEGLPMMITVVLSSNMKRMMRDSVLVRRPVGIETSGNINLLFTDKTGTITEGRLRIKEIHSAYGEAFFSQRAIEKSGEYGKYVTLCANLCNDASFDGKKAIGGDITDRCLKEYFAKTAVCAEVIEKIPFDSTKKYSCVRALYQGREMTFFKGAPEKLIEASEFYLDAKGDSVSLAREEKNKLKSRLQELASKAYRVVCLAIKKDGNVNMESLIFVSLIAIRDKIRKEVPRAIETVQGAGIGVVMITGDNPHTAKEIAKDCGIIRKFEGRTEVLTGAVLSGMSDEEIGDRLPSLAVVARALPSDKSRLVKIAQKKGYVVGMTGDGINDAPSLKMADVGFGMGSGTEVAKEACDIVIGDNNFASISKAILYGRTIFESIRKFIIFQLIMNFAAVGISLLGPFIGVDNPVTVTQMLWVNIIMDTLGALAFAKEPHLNEYMRNKPKKRDEHIISREMVGRIAIMASYILVLCIWFLKSEALPMMLTRGDDAYILSAFFAMFIFSGVFTCFTARTLRLNILSSIGRNKSFVTIMILISIVQMAFIYFGGDTFRSVPIAPSDLIKIILISFTVVVFDLVRKTVGKLLIKEKRNVE